ncbi:Octaprenyl diphosphate synthase [hydrothermal vent metagenome]|uniref:Octaprenyl diphosphate synthase n=1 Tax=hydrothermal vent metagenome TaxID=652676 RepID=A0A3B0YLE9_9ZZZZ
MQELLKNQSTYMDIEDIRALVREDSGSVDALILERLHSDIALINELGRYIINSGGKRLRPLLVLLSARACGYRGQSHTELAAVIEFIHTATLLHDDVVDASSLRRGNQTANAIWGNEAAVLVGDFLYSRAFEMMVGVGSMKVMEILSTTTNIIAEGEVLQLLNCHDPETTEERYRDVIRFKTAKLFEASSRLGAILGKQSPVIEQAMARYGMHLGTAFQLIDDALDYGSSNQDIGKNIGDDLAEGKPTLPLIHAMKHGTPEQAKAIRHAIENGGLEHIDTVMDAIDSTQAIAYTAQSAQQEADLAIEALEEIPASPYREALYGLADFSVNRSY